MKAPAAILLSALALSACGHTRAAPPAPPKAPPPPDWVTGLVPKEEGVFFAVGTSGPTFDPEDARRYAQDDARAQLASTLSARVRAVAVDVQSTTGGWSDSANLIEAQQWSTDTVLTGGEILATWIDERGSVSRRGTAYALGRLNLRAPKVRGGPPPPVPQAKSAGDTRQSAEAAFEALEREEAKH